MDSPLLQAYRARLPQQRARRASDAEPINNDIYASDREPDTDVAPSGLIDRLAQEQNTAEPMEFPDQFGRRRVGINMSPPPTGLPTTKRAY